MSDEGSVHHHINDERTELTLARPFYNVRQVHVLLYCNLPIIQLTHVILIICSNDASKKLRILLHEYTAIQGHILAYPIDDDRLRVAVGIVTERVWRTVKSIDTWIVLFASRATNYGSGWTSSGSTATISCRCKSWAARTPPTSIFYSAVLYEERTSVLRDLGSLDITPWLPFEFDFGSTISTHYTCHPETRAI